MRQSSKSTIWQSLTASVWSGDVKETSGLVRLASDPADPSKDTLRKGNSRDQIPRR